MLNLLSSLIFLALTNLTFASTLELRFTSENLSIEPVHIKNELCKSINQIEHYFKSDLQCSKADFKYIVYTTQNVLNFWPYSFKVIGHLNCPFEFKTTRLTINLSKKRNVPTKVILNVVNDIHGNVGQTFEIDPSEICLNSLSDKP